MSSSAPEIHVDQLIRSKRRSISLEINQYGRLTVRAPHHAADEEIYSLINSKKTWIIEKQNQAFQKMQEAPPKHFVEGEQFLYLGKTYSLEIVDKQPVPLVLNGRFLLAAGKQANAMQIFEKWYREQAARVIKPRTATLAEQNGFSKSGILESLSSMAIFSFKLSNPCSNPSTSSGLRVLVLIAAHELVAFISGLPFSSSIIKSRM